MGNLSDKKGVHIINSCIRTNQPFHFFTIVCTRHKSFIYIFFYVCIIGVSLFLLLNVCFGSPSLLFFKQPQKMNNSKTNSFGKRIANRLLFISFFWFGVSVVRNLQQFAHVYILRQFLFVLHCIQKIPLL